MSFSSDSPDAKKPCKGILKSSSSFDKHSSASSSVHRKSAKFDELNVLQTYHPPDKDYGHMKVDEPKTPFNYVEQSDVDQLDAELLAERLRVAANSPSESVSEDESEEEELNEEQKKRKVDFERRRKAHYNEFEAIRLARKLIEEDEDNDDENVETDGVADSSAPSASNLTGTTSAGSSVSTAPQSAKDDTCMDVEDHDDVDRNGGTARKTKPKTPEHQAGRLKPVSSSAILEESFELRGTRSSAIALIMIVSIASMIFFIVCFTLLFFLVKNS